MKRKNILVLLLIGMSTLGWTQSSQRKVVKLLQAEQINHSLLKGDRSTDFFSETLKVPILNPSPFLAYALVIPNSSIAAASPMAWIRFSKDGRTWEKWNQLLVDSHLEKNQSDWVSELGFQAAAYLYYQYHIQGVDARQNAEPALHFYSPGKTTEHGFEDSPLVESRSCPCPQPNFKNRANWCPNNNCPPNNNPSTHQVTHLIVHHSAGTNTANDWAAVVRSIWDFHVNTRGWSDVGYNWLIDPNGVVYEGRGENILGAHFCGTNSGAEGVCMLGDFTSITPKASAFQSLTQLLAWKACDRNLYPIDRSFHPASGLNLLRVSGHRDGCNTSCPGDAFYPLLDSVRYSVIDYIDNQCNTNILPAPYHLTYTWTGETAIQLNWSYDLASPNIKFSVERSVGEDYRYKALKELPSSETTFKDNTIEANKIYYYRIRAISSSTASAYTNKVIINTAVSSTRHLESSIVLLYPNPAKEQVAVYSEIALSEKAEYQLTDVLGRTIILGKLSKATFPQSISLRGIKDGWYQFTITDSERKWVGKLLIQGN